MKFPIVVLLFSAVRDRALPVVLPADSTLLYRIGTVHSSRKILLSFPYSPFSSLQKYKNHNIVLKKQHTIPIFLFPGML